jgi:putative hydrolase of the HAD superfamily
MTGFRAVVFDYGATLTNPMGESFKDFALQRPGFDFRAISEVLRPLSGASADDTLALRCERGEVDLAELITELDARDPGAGDLFRLETTPIGRFTLNPHMASLHEDARRAGLKTAILSNIFRGLETLYALDHQHWDAVVFSFAVGMRKPEAGIYRHVSRLLDVSPEECLFLDDLPDMCAGARAVGMTAVQVVDHGAAAGEARRLLDMSGTA